MEEAEVLLLIAHREGAPDSPVHDAGVAALPPLRHAMLEAKRALR